MKSSSTLILRGDSLKLSRQAAASKADYIVFCGVHFMAEVADILSRPEQVSHSARPGRRLCHGGYGEPEQCPARLAGAGQRARIRMKQVTPVTYINSAADLKAFCGSHGGIVCTSTNARNVLDWCFEQREKVLFFPDQHLGRNTAYKMGIPLDEMVIWDFDQPMGGLSAEQIKNARMILWKGFCSVHQMFQPEQIDQFLAQYPETKVIAHPESPFEVCQKSDYVGSTEYIIKTIAEAEPNTRWLVGDRTQSGQSSCPAVQTPGQAGAFHVAQRLHVFHHVSHRSTASGLGAGKSGRR